MESPILCECGGLAHWNSHFQKHICHTCQKSINKSLNENDDIVKTWIEEALNIFPNSREMTKEESKAYKEVLDKLYKPTGRTRTI